VPQQSKEELIERARAAVGSDDPDADWQLRPEQHASQLPPEAGALARVLQQPELQDVIERFRKADAMAVVARDNYKRVGHLGLIAATASAIVATVFLMPLDHLFGAATPGTTSGPRLLALTAQYGTLVVAFLASRWLIWRQPFDVWMKARALAEIARIELFDRIMAAREEVRAGELPLLPLQLEYFRRYQLEVQQRYYSGRGSQHARAAGNNARWLTASLVMTGLAALVATLAFLHYLEAWINLHPNIRWLSLLFSQPQASRALLAVGVIASALYGFGVSRSLMNLDERNASRYLTTAENLAYLRQHWLAPARIGAAAGEAGPVLELVRRVQAMVSSEHQEWVLLSQIGAKPNPAMARRPEGGGRA
jgi:hypothetical protein